MRHFSCILGHKCPYYAKDGLGILESPNFPGEYPAGKIPNDFSVICEKSGFQVPNVIGESGRTGTSGSW